MTADSGSSLPCLVNGQLLHLSERHQIAIYSRNDVAWVAELSDGGDQLTDATTWFHFHAGVLRHSHAARAAAIATSAALTPGVQARAQRLHSRADAHEPKPADAEVTLLDLVKRRCGVLVAGIRGRKSGGYRA